MYCIVLHKYNLQRGVREREIVRERVREREREEYTKIFTIIDLTIEII